ncbi:MAG: SPOR domain-containing protein [Treponema sp.]|jgi:hypothetical protein|nr:SPOR domain-containing protein [Treponema sp.]
MRVFKAGAIAICFLLVIGTLIGASIWEGAAAVAPEGVLPNTGYYAATNAFPRNTAVMVTNLENGKTIQVSVAAALDNSSVLMLLSREAADAIALPTNYPGRVRVMETIDPVTMLPPLENRISNGDPDYDPMARINSAQPNSAAPIPEEEPSALAGGGAPAEIEPDGGEPFAPAEIASDGEEPPPVPEEEPSALAGGATPAEIASDGEEPPPVPEEEPSALADIASDDEEPPTLAEEAAQAEIASDGEEPPSIPEEESPALAEGAAPAEIEPDGEEPMIYSEDYSVALVPAENRAPEGKGVDIPLDAQVAPIETRQEKQEQTPDTANFVTSIEDALAASQPQDVGASRTNFSAPMITSMEKGMYYVQLRSYSRPELVENELVKIGKQHNVSVQVTELSGKQLYRILVGPVSYGESNQLLRQYKARGWSDAFVWLGK